MKIRPFLKLIRIHTSSPTQGGVLLAAILAGERRIPIFIAYALWVILVPSSSFQDSSSSLYI